MGPNLLIALLMDGPQLEGRWSAKSATVFAEDPGSSVLTVTSLALVRRILKHRYAHSANAAPSIALWQEPDGSPQEIPLQPDAHAVHFVLRTTQQREVTLDGRSDGGAAEVLRLVRPKKGLTFSPVTHPTPPEWVVPLYRTT